MEFTNDEKKLMVFVLKEHLKEVEEGKKSPDSTLALLSAEEKYTDFVNSLIEKLK
jgi:hypothetical protein